jgi:hypothetical protein
LQVARALKTIVATANRTCRQILDPQLFRFSFGKPTSPSHDLLQISLLGSRFGWRRNSSYAFLLLL